MAIDAVPLKTVLHANDWSVHREHLLGSAEHGHLAALNVDLDESQGVNLVQPVVQPHCSDLDSYRVGDVGVVVDALLHPAFRGHTASVDEADEGADEIVKL